MPRPSIDRPFELQLLEGRLLLSAAAPSSAASKPLLAAPAAVGRMLMPAEVIPATNTPASLLSQAVRQQLVDRLNAGDLKTQLAPLVASAAAFDQALLDYTKANTTARFFFGPANIAGRTSFVTANGLTGSAQARADEVLDHLFPEQAGVTSYTVQLPDAIDWDGNYFPSNPEFLPYLNRFEFWTNLAQAYQFTGNTDYVKEVVNQLASFSAQAPTTSPATWETTGGTGWNLLNASLRIESWVWTYQMLLSSSSWTKEANTLFVSRLWEHGDFLARAKEYSLGSNRALFHAKAQLLIAQLFPEFAGASTWETAARTRMFGALDAQLYNDGSHVEQSPSYTANVLDDALEAKWLDEINGDLAQWPGAKVAKLTNAVESYRQLLSPDTTSPAIGDTYRGVAATMFTKAALIQDLITVKQSQVDDGGASGHSVAHTSLKVDDASQFTVGDQVHLENKSEVMLVTGVNLGTNTLSVSRGYGGTNPLSWVNNAIVYNLGDRTVAKARSRDVWLFGATAMEPFIDIPSTPPLGERGKTKALTDSGNYVARSGDDEDANQVIFDAGPTGGTHGHFDLLNFELYGGGRPLISDPGVYIYGSTPDRAKVVSTPWHNTISVAGANHAALEGATNPGFVVDQYTVTGSSVQVTAHHHGYQSLAGRPVVGRSMWYDLDGTILIVDWGESNAAQTFQQSYNVQTEGDINDVTVDGTAAPNQTLRTRFDDGGNVKIVPLARPGQTAARNGLSFVTNDSSGGDYKDDAYRFTVTQNGTFVYFVTLITAYDGTAAPDTTATLLTTNATAGQTIQVQLTKEGEAPQTISFVPPQLERAASVNLGHDAASANDVAYDSTGRLHMAFFDRASRTLKYAVQETSGAWSAIETVDNGLDTGVYLSLALDSNNLPGIAYFDGNAGDLKYTKYVGGAWQTNTLDSVGSVGLYPALAFSRNNGPAITYYHRTKGDLRLVTAATEGFVITTLDSAGDVGRFSSIVLDPNRTDSSKFAIGYEDTGNANMKYAVQGTFGGAQGYNAGYSFYLADDMISAGGYTSLAFYDSGTADTKRYKPSMSYYNPYNSSLTYAYSPDGVAWVKQTIAGAGASKEGLYTNLVYDNAGRANIFFFDKTNNLAKRAKKNGGAWSFTALATGGRELQVAKKSTGALAYTTLDDTLPRLDVQYLGS